MTLRIKSENVQIGFCNRPMVTSPFTGSENIAENVHYQPDFSVYPNPTSREININLKDYSGRNAQIEIFSLEGKLMKMINIDQVQQTSETIQLDTYSGGMYFIKLKSEGLPDVTKRIEVLE